MGPCLGQCADKARTLICEARVRSPISDITQILRGRIGRTCMSKLFQHLEAPDCPRSHSILFLLPWPSTLPSPQKMILTPWGVTTLHQLGESPFFLSPPFYAFPACSSPRKHFSSSHAFNPLSLFRSSRCCSRSKHPLT